MYVYIYNDNVHVVFVYFSVMASGGGNPFRKSATTDPRQKSSWQRTASASDKDDNISLNSLPNDLRPNNWVCYHQVPCNIHCVYCY